MSKLKVGDRVELLSFEDAPDNRNRISWGDTDSRLVGERATIVGIDRRNDARVKPDSGGEYWWRCEALRKIEDAEPTPQELYRLMAKHSGLEAGDRVRFVRLWQEGEYGCHLEPDNDEDDKVGREGTVIEIDDGDVKVEWLTGAYDWLPPFTLVKIQQPKFLAGDYEVSFNKDGSIEVDGINVPFEQLETIYERAKARR